MPVHEEQNRSGIDTERTELYLIKTETLVYLHNERHICVPIFIKNLLPSGLPVRA